MGQVPSAWNALPPLLHLANSYSSFKTQLKRTSSRKPTLISQAADPFCLCAPVSCASHSLSQWPACCLWLSLSESGTPNRL